MVIMINYCIIMIIMKTIILNIVIMIIICVEFTILNSSKEPLNDLLAELLQPVVDGERIPETGTLVVALAVDNSLFRF